MIGKYETLNLLLLKKNIVIVHNEFLLVLNVNALLFKLRVIIAS